VLQWRTIRYWLIYHADWPSGPSTGSWIPKCMVNAKAETPHPQASENVVVVVVIVIVMSHRRHSLFICDRISPPLTNSATILLL